VRTLITVLLFFVIQPLRAAELQTKTVEAWDQYVRWADAKVHREVSDSKTFLIQNGLKAEERAAVLREIESGGIYVHQVTGVIPPKTHFDVPEGEIHHWWGTILIRNISIPQLRQFLQDYDHHAGKFSDVERAKLLSRNGNQYRVFFRFRRSKAFVTAVYNTEQDCIYTEYGSNRFSSQSVATKIAEIEDPGTASEREKVPGHDRGFLWRLVSWWRYEQRGNDVLVELESASLSRDIPSFIKFIPGISGYIRSTPKESLESVLTSIRDHAR
jgi:hypothetical protein